MLTHGSMSDTESSRAVTASPSAATADRIPSPKTTPQSYWYTAYIQLLAMVRTLGSPTWYLTFSCYDLNWTDILKVLLEADNRGNVSVDELTFEEEKYLVNKYPVLVARQFMKRVNAVMRFLKAYSILGASVVDFWWRVEFQLRGSPHVHMVVWCADTPKFDTAEGIRLIDRVMSCCSSTDDPSLNELVNRVQRHKHTDTCYKKSGQKNCRFGFPREVCSETRFLGPDEAIANGGRFCILRRQKGDEMVNNYNATLLKMWGANIDIQPCGSAIGLAYYISKYIAKSEPTVIAESISKALLEIENSNSDVGRQMFIVSMAILNQRQVSASECAFRLCHLKLRDSSRTSIFVNNCFPENRYRMLKFYDGTVFENIFDKYERRPFNLEELSLAEFAVRYENVTFKSDMKENIDSSGSDEEILENPRRATYITLLNGSKMKVRKKAAVLRTRYFSQISNREEYYYGLLVCHLPFRDEKSILDGYDSAYEAFYAKSNQLKPISGMSIEDFSNIEREIHDNVRKIVAEKVAQNLTQVRDVNNDETNVPDVNIDHDIISSIQSEHHIDEADLVDMEEDRMTDHQYTTAVSILNIQQKALFSKIAKVVSNDSSPQVLTFVTGGAGSGKTFTLKLIVEHIRRLSSSNAVVIAAPTGVAAKLVNGRTLHSLFGLPIERPRKKGEGSAPLKPFTGERLQRERTRWKQIKWLIIDEISMVSYHVLRMIHLRLQELRPEYNTELFGGVNVILFGDLMQLPPVSRTSVAPYCFYQPSIYAGEIHLWKSFSFCELTTNMRQQEDATFIDLLNNLRVGQLNMEHIHILDERRLFAESEDFVDAIRIFPTVKQVDDYNNKVINRLRENGVKCYLITAQDSSKEPKSFGQIPDIKYIPTDINQTAGVPREIQIGIGFRIMLRRNLNVQNGLVNGSMGTIVGIKWPHLRDDQLEDGDLPESLSIKFDDIQEVVEILPTNFAFDGLRGYGKIERRMLPLILCWAVTVHKLQGVTLSKAVIDLGPKLFAKGQAYVALSRVRSLEGIAVSNLNVNRLLNAPHNELCVAELHRLRDLPK